MSAYDNESYLLSLAGSRSDVDRQIQNTMSEVGRQHNVALGQLGQADAATGRVFDQGRGAINQDSQSLTSSLGSRLSGLGVGPDTAGLSALGQQQNAFKAATPLLSQGFGEQAAQRRGQVDSIGKQLYADNDAKRADYITRREGEDRQKAFEAAQAQIQREAQERALRTQIEASNAANAAMIHAQSLEAERQRQFLAGQGSLDRTHQASLANPPKAPKPAQSSNPYITRFGRAS